MGEQMNIVVQSFSRFLDQLAAFLPQFLAAVAILILGWIIAKIVKVLFVKSMKAVRLDTVTARTGIDNFLAQGGIRKTAVELLGAIMYWLILFVVFLVTFNSVGLFQASELFTEVVLFIPNVLISALVLIAGLFFAKFVAETITASLKNMEVDHAGLIGKVSQYLIIMFSISIILTQLNIGTEIVISAFQISFGAVCLALALSFGLGGRDWATKFLDHLFKDRLPKS